MSTIEVSVSGETINVVADEFIEDMPLFDSLVQVENTGENAYSLPLKPLPCLSLACFLRRVPGVRAKSGDVKKIKELANKVPKPKAVLSEDGKRVVFLVPYMRAYRRPLYRMNAISRKDGTLTLPVEKALDALDLIKVSARRAPKVAVDERITQMFSEPIPGFDGSLSSLKQIPLTVLHVVSADNQSMRERRASKGSMSDKFARLGVKTLYDLLFYLPYRHIDKSNPQQIAHLVEGETSVVEGKITRAATFKGAKAGGARFTIQDATGWHIDVSFFNQEWLTTRFKEGAHVIITGKMKWYGKPTIAGTSIEFADQSANLPIVPVYRQSPTNGLTTYRILCAIRELLMRLDGRVKLEPYFSPKVFPNFFSTIHSLHIPDSVDEHYRAIEQMAMRELFYAQVLLQVEREDSKGSQAVALTNTQAVDKAVDNLPFTLTRGQQKAIETLSKKLSNNVPAEVMLTADVGSGKTVCAQLCAIQAYCSSGGQSVVLSPTEVLANQLYESTLAFVSSLPEDMRPSVLFYSGSLSAKEKKEAREKIAQGQAQIIVGTHGLLDKSVKYHNLVFVAIDEQQKFGTDQRKTLLNSRADGKRPHVLMQTATPIPRSIAQVIYGDLTLIELKDRPAGRQEIKTTWIQQNPNEFIHEHVNEAWELLQNEVEKGHQAFIVAPVVNESERADTASVKTVYDTLRKGVLSQLKVGMVHGQMKKVDQQEQMSRFRNKDYDVMVCSTIVEVGVDIPDATVVVILSADRMGASSLHQIRGRVGRNSFQSYCVLVSEAQTDSATERLTSLVECSDGFEIARRDMANRGEGKVLSLSQSGKSEMQFVSLLRDTDKMALACESAREVIESKWADMAISDARELFILGDENGK